MPKPILYIIILFETILLIAFGVIFIQLTNEAEKNTAPEQINFSSRAMTVYVKSAGKGDVATDVVGKMYVQDDATGRSEFLFDVGAGCFPTWTLNPQAGYNLLILDDVDVDAESLDMLMRDGLLRYEFNLHTELQITKTMGIRSVILTFDQQRLLLTQQCS